jgi:hypothetical protein
VIIHTDQHKANFFFFFYRFYTLDTTCIARSAGVHLLGSCLRQQYEKTADRLFTHFTGRLDPYSKGVIPFQNVFVGEVIAAKPPAANYCE